MNRKTIYMYNVILYNWHPIQNFVLINRSWWRSSLWQTRHYNKDTSWRGCCLGQVWRGCCMYIYCCEISTCLIVLHVCGEKLLYPSLLTDILIKLSPFQDKKKLSHCTCTFNSLVSVGFIIVINSVWWYTVQCSATKSVIFLTDCKCQAVLFDIQFLPEDHQILPVFGSGNSMYIASLDKGLLQWGL